MNLGRNDFDRPPVEIHPFERGRARANGFEPYDFSTVTRDFDGGLLEYDAVFVRER